MLQQLLTKTKLLFNSPEMLTVSARLSALSFWSLRACCRARISALCSLTACSTAWRDSVLRCSARSLQHSAGHCLCSSLDASVAFLNSYYFNQASYIWLLMCAFSCCKVRGFFAVSFHHPALPTPTQKVISYISQNTFWQTLENMPKHIYSV